MLNAGRPGMKDVAARAGVSVATVSHVVNGTRQVTAATAQRVRAAMDSLGYVRNDAARQLRQGRSDALGAIVLDLANPYFTEFARGIEDRALSADQVVMLCSSDEDPSREATLMTSLVRRGVEGIIVSPCASTVVNLDIPRRSNCPVVLMDYRQESDGIGVVGVDDVAGGQIALQHLADLGHRVVGLINDTHRLPHCEARWRGAEGAAKERGIRLIETNVATHGPLGAGHALRTLLFAHPEVTAVFCFNDLAAFGALAAAHDLGLSVPGDLTVVGYDDIPVARHAVVPLTTIRQPIRALGYAAADMILQWPGGDRRRMFSPELVVRGSAARPR